MPKTDGNGTSVIRALRVLEALKGNALEGLSNVEIAKRTGESEVNVSRTLKVLVAAGWVTRHDTGRFAQSVRFLQMAEAFALECDRATSRITELRQRVAAGARR